MGVSRGSGFAPKRPVEFCPMDTVPFRANPPGSKSCSARGPPPRLDLQGFLCWSRSTRTTAVRCPGAAGTLGQVNNVSQGMKTRIRILNCFLSGRLHILRSAAFGPMKPRGFVTAARGCNMVHTTAVRIPVRVRGRMQPLSQPFSCKGDAMEQLTFEASGRRFSSQRNGAGQPAFPM